MFLSTPATRPKRAVVVQRDAKGLVEDMIEKQPSTQSNQTNARSKTPQSAKNEDESTSAKWSQQNLTS